MLGLDVSRSVAASGSLEKETVIGGTYVASFLGMSVDKRRPRVEGSVIQQTHECVPGA